MSEPLVSVVVSTYNRPDRLERMLDGLRVQTLPAERFEVVVVDNGSTGAATGAVLERAASRPGLQLRSTRHEPTLGPAGGRNSGWRLARAPLVAFTDDDCRPDPGWLAAGLRAHFERPAAVIQGATRPDPGELADDGPLSRTVLRRFARPPVRGVQHLLPARAARSARRIRRALRRDPRRRGHGPRVARDRGGAPTAFASDAVVYHAIERLGAVGMLRFAGRGGRGVRVFADHPGARAMLHRRVFWNVWHYLLWRSLLALLMPRWRQAAGSRAAPARAAPARAPRWRRRVADPVPARVRRGRVLVDRARRGPAQDGGAVRLSL